MSTTGKIKTLFSDIEKKEALFPRTKISAISDENGVGLEAVLERAAYVGEAVDSSVVPVNADTLGGRPADEYATETFVTAKIAAAQLDGGDVDLSGYATKDDVSNAVKAIDYPVDSVNGKTGAVQLGADDVGALPKTGGTVNGNLNVQNGYIMNGIDGKVSLAGNEVGGFLEVFNGNSPQKRRQFILVNPAAGSDIDGSLILTESDGTNNQSHYVLHGGNFNNFALPLTGGTLTGYLKNSLDNQGMAYFAGTNYGAYIEACKNGQFGTSRRQLVLANPETPANSALSVVDVTDGSATGFYKVLTEANMNDYYAWLRTYEFHTSNGMVDLLKENWSKILSGVFMIYGNVGGGRYYYVGGKSDNYGAALVFNYNNGSIMHYRNVNGTWYEAVHS